MLHYVTCLNIFLPETSRWSPNRPYGVKSVIQNHHNCWKHVMKAMRWFLVGGWTNPVWKIWSSNWIISPGIGVKIKNIWNHQLDLYWFIFALFFPYQFVSFPKKLEDRGRWSKPSCLVRFFCPEAEAITDQIRLIKVDGVQTPQNSSFSNQVLEWLKNISTPLTLTLVKHMFNILSVRNLLLVWKTHHGSSTKFQDSMVGMGWCQPKWRTDDGPSKSH